LASADAISATSLSSWLRVWQAGRLVPERQAIKALDQAHVLEPYGDIG